MDRLRKYLRILLPALFIAYLGCIIAFTHVHIVNGVTIVHSAFVAILLAAFYSFIRNLSFAPVYPDYIVPFRGRRTLRAPPIF